MKKGKKQMMDLTETSMLGAAGSMALGGLGGSVATQGQRGISRAVGQSRAIGSMIGLGMLVRGIKQPKPRKVRRWL